MVNKLIIENRADMSMLEAIERCKCIVESGRVSGEGDKAQYCYYSVFNDGIAVAAFKNKHSDRLVVTRTNP